MADHPKRKRQPSRPTLADPEQYQRFVEAARELGCDDSEEAFEHTFMRIVPPRRAGQPVPSQAEARARAKAPKRHPRS